MILVCYHCATVILGVATFITTIDDLIMSSITTMITTIIASVIITTANSIMRSITTIMSARGLPRREAIH